MKAYEVLFDKDQKEIERIEIDVTKLSRGSSKYQPYLPIDGGRSRSSTIWILNKDEENHRRILYPAQVVFSK